MLFFCQTASRMRRYGLAAAATASAALLPALFVLPAPLSHPVVLCAMATLLLAAAALCRGDALRPGLLRDVPPRTVHVDGSLLAQGRAVTSVCLPLSDDPSTPLRQRPGALLMASAAVCTLDAVGSDAAPLASMLAGCGFTRETFLARCPVQGETEVNGVRGVVTRDGQGQRAYFTAAPDALLNACDAVWDGAPRPVTQADRALAADLTRPGTHAFAMAAVTPAGAEQLIYLGSASAEAVPCSGMQAAVARLKAQGFTVCGTPTPQANDPAAYASAHVTLADSLPADGLRLEDGPAPDVAVLAACHALYRLEAALTAALAVMTAVTLAGCIAGVSAAVTALCCAMTFLLLPCPAGTASPCPALPRRLAAWLPLLGWTALAAAALCAFARAAALSPDALALLLPGMTLPLLVLPPLGPAPQRLSRAAVLAAAPAAALIAGMLTAPPLHALFMALGGGVTGLVGALASRQIFQRWAKCS